MKKLVFIMSAALLLQWGCATSQEVKKKTQAEDVVDVDDGEPSAKRARPYGELSECERELKLTKKTCGGDVSCQVKMLEVANHDFDSDGKSVVCFDSKKSMKKKTPKRIVSPLEDGEG